MWVEMLLGIMLMQAPAPQGIKVADERLYLHTDAGTIVIALYPDVAPQHVRQILNLVNAGVYNGTCFARIEPNFVLQLSAAESDRQPPLTSNLAMLIKPLPAELSQLRHVRGTVSMAREDGNMNSAKTSFSILLGDAPHLDGKYTILGHVEYGMDVADELAKAPLTGNRPRKRLKVQPGLVTAEQLKKQPPAPAQKIFAEVEGSQQLESRQIQTAIEQRAVLYTVGILLMITCMLIGVFMPHITTRQIQTLNLMAVLIGAFLLVATLLPISIEFFQSDAMTNAGHIIAIGIFFGLLGVFRLMSRFESAS